MSQDMEKQKYGSEFIPGAMGERIACLRKNKKMTQAQVAEQLGISAQAVSKWESGLSCPDIMTLVPLANVLGVTTDQLLGVGDSKAGLEKDFDTCKPEEAVRAGEAAEPIENCDPVHEPPENTEEKAPKAAEDPRESAVKATNFIMVQPEKERESQKVLSISVNAGACYAVIETGNRFSLRTEGYEEGEVISEIVNGVWKVKDTFRVISFIGRKMLDKRKIMITVPEGYFFETANLNMGAGVMTAAGIRAENLVLEVGAGQMKLKDIYSNGAKINCDMGEILIRGELYGKCKADCGMGSIKAFIREPDHYGYKLSVGMGDVKIGSCKISGLGGEQVLNKGDSNFYNLSCSMGSIQFDFEH